ncbi:MAG: cytochrome-c peroxidase, partial [Pseudomonadota bacterium]
EGVVRHHLDPIASLRSYDRTQAKLPKHGDHNDFAALDDERTVTAIAAANELKPVALDDNEVADLLAFLRSLTDDSSLKGRLGRPDAVPSGLPVDK